MTETPHIIQITPNLWLGSFPSVKDTKTLKNISITLIFNLSGFKIDSDEFDVQTAVLPGMEVMPQETTREISRIKELAGELHNCIQGGDRVLVVCDEGINQAPYLVAAYLILHASMQNVKAIINVQDWNAKCGRKSFTNKSFQKILEKLA